MAQGTNNWLKTMAQLRNTRGFRKAKEFVRAHLTKFDPDDEFTDEEAIAIADHDGLRFYTDGRYAGIQQSDTN